MNEQSYTHRDLARLLGVSETTIKSYRSKFPTFLPVARAGKPVRLHPEALDVCRKIRDLFADGLSIIQATDSLHAEFKEYPLNRRLSTLQRSAQETASNSALGQRLEQRMEALALAQEASRLRMEQMEAELRNLAILEAASKSLVADLLGELRAARPQAPPASAVPAPPPPVAPPPDPAPAADGPTVLTARRIVTVHDRTGPVASYALNHEPRPELPFAPITQPGGTFLDLPAVILSDRNDFLGLPGGQSVRRLVETLSPEGADPVTWFEEGPEAWTCAIPLGRAQTREILFERTTTPRGNLVGLIRRMRINEAEATPAQLQDIFRQIRDQMS